MKIGLNGYRLMRWKNQKNREAEKAERRFAFTPSATLSKEGFGRELPDEARHKCRAFYIGAWKSFRKTSIQTVKGHGMS